MILSVIHLRDIVLDVFFILFQLLILIKCLVYCLEECAAVLCDDKTEQDQEGHS